MVGLEHTGFRLLKRLLVPSLWVPLVWMIISWNLLLNARRLHIFTWVMLSLHVVCFVCCQLQPVSSIPSCAEADWQACERAGRSIPPRSRFVNRANAVVLGFDHWCWWLGTPIGLHNRKAFVLYLLYSGLLCAGGAAVSLQAMYNVEGTLPSFVGAALPGMLSTFPVISFLFVQVGVQVDSFVGAELFTLVLDMLIGIGLLFFGVYHFVLVLRNETFIETGLAKDRGRSLYDVGWRTNWQQVMGANPMLWFVPFGDPGCDGVHWPTRQIEEAKEK